MPDFLPGLTLCGRFYRDVVRPILDDDFPGLPHSAALIGPGSEVLGFDTEMSSDHDWGPRVLLYLREDDGTRLRSAIHDTLSQRLPPTFLGYPTDFTGGGPSKDDARPIRHRVETWTLRSFLQTDLGYDPADPLEAADWLTFPEQKLRALTAGEVYHDGAGLQALRERFAWYPHDVWLYLLAAGWGRVGQECHLMGRAGSVGDDLGSALLGSRLVRDVMRLGFLMERQYAPYPKWFGTAFTQLGCAETLSPLLQSAMRAHSWQERETCLVAAYGYLAAMHNALGLTEPQKDPVGYFHTRPFRVPDTDKFRDALLAAITDPGVERIASGRLIGSIDQFSDSTDLLSDAKWRGILRQLYER